MAWNGYRASKIDCGGASNGYVTPRAKQDWTVGEIVNVGFIRDLEVIKKQGPVFVLWQATKNRFYSFQPHLGICRHGSLNEALQSA